MAQTRLWCLSRRLSLPDRASYLQEAPADIAHVHEDAEEEKIEFDEVITDHGLHQGFEKSDGKALDDNTLRGVIPWFLKRSVAEIIAENPWRRKQTSTAVQSS